jgi:hypothetical protein
MTVVVELKPTPGVYGKAKPEALAIVTGDEPMTVKAEHVVAPEQVTEVVATFAKVFGPEKYERLLITAADDVERPVKERVGVLPPDD